MIKYVIKRDGRKKEFLWDRIEQAIKNAYVDVYKNEDKFKEEYNFIYWMASLHCSLFSIFLVTIIYIFIYLNKITYYHILNFFYFNFFFT